MGGNTDKGDVMLSQLITDKQRDPLGMLLLDYLNGNKDAALEVESPDFEMWTMTGTTMFRDYEEMSELERSALSMCHGRVLDVGAGSGCHSLILQEKGLQVDAIDISPGSIEVMQKRGVNNYSHANVFSLRERKYNTILMLMNGLGICGSLDGCNLFLQFISSLLVNGGQVLTDSTNFSHSFNIDCHSLTEGYPGETEFVMRYAGCESDPFAWVYVDFETLRTLAGTHDLDCQCVMTANDGRYLARISFQ